MADFFIKFANAKIILVALILYNTICRSITIWQADSYRFDVETYDFSMFIFPYEIATNYLFPDFFLLILFGNMSIVFHIASLLSCILLLMFVYKYSAIRVFFIFGFLSSAPIMYWLLRAELG
jgi:hypothetical protein